MSLGNGNGSGVAVIFASKIGNLELQIASPIISISQLVGLADWYVLVPKTNFFHEMIAQVNDVEVPEWTLSVVLF